MKKKSPIMETILETLSSKTGSSSKTDAAGAATSETPKNFTQLIEEVAAIKTHLDQTHYCLQEDSKILLLTSVQKVLQIVNRYRFATKNTMPRFDWESKQFEYISPLHRFRLSLRNKSVKKDLLKADSPRNTVKEEEGHSLHFQNKEYWCLCSAQDVVGMEEPMINDSNCVTLRRLIKRSEARASTAPSPSSVDDQTLLTVPRFISPFFDHPNMNDLPALNVEEKKIWLEFKDFDKGTPEAHLNEVLDRRVVSVIGEFAVAVFNKACEMHVKKGEHNLLHDLECTECKYTKFTNGYCFYMTIEAIEEGNLGVYETEVMCSSDDDCRRILSKFVLTNRTPVGTKAMAIFHFSCVRSIGKCLEGVTYHKLRKPYKICAVAKRKDRGPATRQISCIWRHHQNAIQSLQQVLCQDPPLLFSPDCDRTTNQDDWSHPDDCDYSPMVRRTKGTPCEGYDYVRH